MPMERSRLRRTWLVVLALLLVLLAWRLARPVLLPEDSPGAAGHYLTMMAQEAAFFGIPALFLRPWRMRAARRATGSGCAISLAAGAALALMMNPISAGWSSLLLMAPREMPVPSTMPEWALLVLAAVVVPALAEEAFFRGGVLCGLAQGMGGEKALALTVMLFALIHGRVAALPAHLACGALFTLSMLRYGGLWSPTVTHLTYNAVTLALAWRGVTLPWASLLATVPVTAALAGVMLRGVTWPEGEKLKGADLALGIAAMTILGLYFVVQLR
ncbi:MAG: CPBP family intramembrane metalloprotease [Christensenellaceae bacterium]|nr:CPBP family intramembrane metalloprotease [Christensenellaceae bacterium]